MCVHNHKAQKPQIPRSLTHSLSHSHSVSFSLRKTQISHTLTFSPLLPFLLLAMLKKRETKPYKDKSKQNTLSFPPPLSRTFPLSLFSLNFLFFTQSWSKTNLRTWFCFRGIDTWNIEHDFESLMSLNLGFGKSEIKPWFKFYFAFYNFSVQFGEIWLWKSWFLTSGSNRWGPKISGFCDVRSTGPL